MIHYGFSSIACPDHDVAQIAELAARTGLDVELRFVSGTVEIADLPEFAPERLADTARVFADAGVGVVGVDSSARFASPDAGERAANRAIAARDIALAAGLGASYLRVFGGTLPPDLDADARRERLREIVTHVNEVAAQGRAQGVDVLLETHDDFCTGASIVELEGLGLDPEVGILWDTLHSFRNGESFEQTWAAIGPRVRHVHVKDASRADASGFDLVLTGEGIVGVGEALDLLTEAGYEGHVNLEWEKGWHPELEDADVAIPHFAAWLASGGRR